MSGWQMRVRGGAALNRAVAAVLLGSLAAAVPALGQQTLVTSSPAYLTAVATPRTYMSGTAGGGQAGAGFTTGSGDINVSALGFFDINASTTGLAGTHQVAVYLAGQNNVPSILLGEVTVPTGVGTVIDGYSFQSVSSNTPLTLMAGQSYILTGDYGPNGANDKWYDYQELNWNSTLLAASPETRAARYTGTDTPADPTAIQGFDSAYGAANFDGSVTTSANLTSSNWSGSSANLTDGSSSVVLGPSVSGSNDDLTNANIRGLEFSAGAPSMTVSGNGFVLSGAIANYSTNLQTVNTTQISLNQSFISAINGPLVINSDLNIGNGNGVSAGVNATTGAVNTASVSPLILTGANDITLNGALSGDSDIYFTFTGNVFLNGDNSNFSNNLVIYAGKVQASNGNALGSSSATVSISSNTNSELVISGNATYNQNLAFVGRSNVQSGAVAQNPALLNSGNNNWAGTITANGGGNYVIDSGGPNDVLTLSGTLNTTSDATFYLQGSGNGYLTGGVFVNNATTGTGGSGIFKVGTGTWTIDVAPGSMIYKGPTRVSRGTLIADYNDQAASAPTNSQISSQGLLEMGGGTFEMIGSDIATTSQSVTSTVLVSGGQSAIVVNNGSTATATLALGAITRSNGGALDFNGTGTSTTTTANTNGILGGWATMNGGATWAANDGNGNIVPFTGYTNDTWAAGNNTDVTMSSAPASGSTTNTVRFNQAAANTITLSGANVVAGGILVTPNVGNNTTTITGGTLSAPNTASFQDLVIQQFNTAAPLVISSVIANAPNPASQTGSTTTGTAVVTGVPSTAGLVVGQTVAGTGIPSGTTIKSIDSSSQITLSANATATSTSPVTLNFTALSTPLTKAGPGALMLSAVNTFTGAVYLDSGTISFGLPNTLAAENVYPYADNALDFTPQPNGTTIMIGNLGGFGNINLNQGGNTYNLNLGANNSGVQYDGTISGTGNVIKSGTGQDTWGNPNTFTGSLTLSGGRISFKNATIGGSSITVADGAEAYILISGTYSEPWTISGAGLSDNSGEAALRVGSNSIVNITGAITLTGTAHTADMGADAGSTLNLNSAITGTNTNLGLGDYTSGAVNGYVNVNGPVSLGSGNLAIYGPVTLNSTITYTGTTSITNNGDLQVGTGGTTGALTSTATITTGNGGVQNNLGWLIIDRSDTVTLPNVIAGSQGVMQIGSGTLDLTGTNTFTRGVQIQNGTVQATTAANLGGTAAAVQFWYNGGTLQTLGTFASTHPVALYVNGTIDSDGNNASFGAVTAVPGTTLTKIGAGGTAFASLGSASLPMSLAVNAGTVAITPNGTATGASYLSSLSIAPGAALDLTNNGMLLNYTGASPLSTIVSEIKAGYNNGLWNGTSTTGGVITSSSAATQAHQATALGYSDNGSEVEVKYTWYGDTNLDGVVNSADVSNISASGNSWGTGDFNYDGKVNADDWSLFLLGAAAQDGSIISGVPEPMSMALMVLPALVALRRRRV